MIKLLSSLDREVTSQYKIAVRVIDMGNDVLPDPLRQRSATAQVTINVLVRVHLCLIYCYYLTDIFSKEKKSKSKIVGSG